IVASMVSMRDSRTPDNGSLWVATCEVAGQHYEARSRRGALHALARDLVEAGGPHAPIRGNGPRWAAFKSAPKRATRESATTPRHRERFEGYPTRRAKIDSALPGEGQNTGSGEGAARGVAESAQSACTKAPQMEAADAG